MEWLGRAVGANAPEQFHGLGLRRRGEGVVRHVGRALAGSDDAVQHILVGQFCLFGRRVFIRRGRLELGFGDHGLAIARQHLPQLHRGFARLARVRLVQDQRETLVTQAAHLVEHPWELL